MPHAFCFRVEGSSIRATLLTSLLNGGTVAYLTWELGRNCAAQCGPVLSGYLLAEDMCLICKILVVKGGVAE